VKFINYDGKGLETFILVVKYMKDKLRLLTQFFFQVFNKIQHLIKKIEQQNRTRAKRMNAKKIRYNCSVFCFVTWHPNHYGQTGLS